MSNKRSRVESQLSNKRARVQTRSQTLWKNNDFTTFLHVMRGNPEMQASFREGLQRPLFFDMQPGQYFLLYRNVDVYELFVARTELHVDRDTHKTDDPNQHLFKVPILEHLPGDWAMWNVRPLCDIKVRDYVWGRYVAGEMRVELEEEFNTAGYQMDTMRKRINDNVMANQAAIVTMLVKFP